MSLYPHHSVYWHSVCILVHRKTCQSCAVMHSSVLMMHHWAAGGTQGNLDALATAPASSKQQRFAMEAVQEVDRCITELASALPVDIMPGPGDLSNHALPQQPLHQCLFPGAAPCENFFRATNPYRFSLDGLHLLGCSGQNLHDIMRCERLFSLCIYSRFVLAAQSMFVCMC